jgi:putative FmdB family regulatory protein
LPPSRQNGKQWEIPAEEVKSLPLYPYRCTACGHRFEKIQKFGAKPEKVCPKCGGALERTLTAPGLNFKGAGWYVNDYAAKSGKSGAESGGGSGPESAPAEKKTGADTRTDSGAKTESKTESKSESKSASGGESGSSSSAKSTPATPSGTGTK